MIYSGPVDNPIDRAQLIRLSLQNLGEINGHHLFERVCFEVARARIAANFRCAAGPVSAGGDHGRDGETYWTDLPDGGRASPSLAPASRVRMVMACTIQKHGIPTKIKRDIGSICSQGKRVGHIAYFLSHSLAENRLHELQDWARAEYGVGLDVWDGQAIARTLSDPDLWFVAERYLNLPLSSIASPTAAGGAPVSRPVNRRPGGRRRGLKIAFCLPAVLAVAGVAMSASGHVLNRQRVYQDWPVRVVAGKCAPGWKHGDQVARSVVDLDGRLSTAVAGSADVVATGDARDLAYYIDCPTNRPRIMLYAGLATLVKSDPSWQQCESAVPRKVKMIVTPQVGQALCSRTGDGAVVLIRVRELAVDGTSATLVVTLWR